MINSCQEMNRYIPLFIKDSLSGEELSEFISHIKECESCYEEVEISFLVDETVKRLESDSESFDIHAGFLGKLKACERFVGLYNVAVLCRRIMLLLAAFCVCSSIIMTYIL